jgi:hypothetical protein
LETPKGYKKKKPNFYMSSIKLGCRAFLKHSVYHLFVERSFDVELSTYSLILDFLPDKDQGPFLMNVLISKN